MPKTFSQLSLMAIVLVSLVFFVARATPWQGEQNQSATRSDSSSTGDENFDKMMSVLTHKRCVNCHPSDGVPKQGEDSHPHYFGIKRGKDDSDQGGNRGFEATKCNTCHQAENNEFSGVPGAPDWSLAPESMRWAGLSPAEIAESMLDPKRNGNRNHEQVMHHLTEHELVLWAWDPGVNADGKTREPPPVPKDEYVAAVKQWFEDGAKIPEDAKGAAK